MARTRTLTELIAEIMERGDFRAIRHPSADVTRRINQSIATFYDLVCSVNKDYFLDLLDVTVVSGTSDYSLPATFYKLLGIDVLEGGRWYSVGKMQFSERNRNQEGRGDRKDVRYRIMGQKIYLRPTPTWGGTMRVWYIPAPPVLTSGSDTFDGIAGWEEFVIVDGVIKGKLKDEESAEDWMIEREQLKGRIRDLAAERDSGEPDRVRDVYVEGLGQPTYWDP